MPSPIHSILRSTLLAEGHDIRSVAANLKIPEMTLTRVLQGREPISPELAVRLEEAGHATAETWLVSQANYDIEQARKELSS